ncbi:hypothetical protein [uncultured Zoogloea sp.]|uniref:hypothetical protein n=1 Tax=uncultured Zoogloea sp. TaxID=160237 RepID=UPI00261FA666|nr:hypothetical protein [uncultured Zoogloea sp.]
MDKIASVRKLSEAYLVYKQSRILVELANGGLNLASLVEIESAVDHLFRGLSVESSADPDRQFDKALDHILRATLDNLQALFSRSSQLVTEIRKSRHAKVLSDPDVIAFLNKIKMAQGTVAAVSELNFGTVHQVLSELSNDVDVLEKLNQGYLAARSIGSRREVYLAFLAFAVGIISSMIASALFALWK